RRGCLLPSAKDAAELIGACRVRRPRSCVRGSREARPAREHAGRGARTGRIRRARALAGVSELLAHAKINLALVVGPRRTDGKPEVTTVLQRVGLTDRLELESADALAVEGFPDDTLIRRSLELIAEAAGVEPAWRVVVDKRIPVAAGLGGGSADAAAALLLANE